MISVLLFTVTAALPWPVRGNWMRKRVSNIAMELSLQSPPCHPGVTLVLGIIDSSAYPARKPPGRNPVA